MEEQTHNTNNHIKVCPERRMTMIPSYHDHEKFAQAHRQNLLNEAEHERLLAQLPKPDHSSMRRFLARPMLIPARSPQETATAKIASQAEDNGKTSLTGERTENHLARTPAGAFGCCRIRYRPRARASASFGCDPGRRCDPIAQQLTDTPDMIGQATGHRRSPNHPRALASCLLGSRAT